MTAGGHRDIRASHVKTLEFTRGPSITARATCVLGVGAELDPEELGLLRGPVRLTVAAAGHQISGEAVINPGHAVGDRLVIRRSDRADPDTLAVRSTLTAADLAPAMVAALADPGTGVTLTLTELEPAPPLVLIGPPPLAASGDRLGLLWRHADTTVDLGMRAGDGAKTGPGEIVAAVAGAPLDQAPPAALGRLAELAATGARFAALGGTHPATLPLVAAGLPTAPALWLGRADRRTASREEFTASLRDSRVPVVVSLAAEDAAQLLKTVARAEPERRLAMPDGRLDVGLAMTWTDLEHGGPLLRERGDDLVTIVVAGRASGGERVDLETLLRVLTGAGIPARTIGEALRPLGLNRRRIYDLLQSGRGDQPPPR